MALFGGDKKKAGDKPAAASPATQAKPGAAADASDFDSPVESVSLTAAKKPVRDERAERAAREAEEAERALRDYGIEQAIQLMRLLPGDSNVELVVQVVKKTLESTNIKVPKIIEDASRKQKDIENRVSNLEREISDLEREIQTRESEIERLQTDHKETTMVKERLQLAEQLAWAGGAPPGTPGPGGAAPPPLPEPDAPKQSHEEALTTPARLGTQG
jgi:hypothetical protein